MLGLMSFLAEAKIPGSVPLLDGVVKPYAVSARTPRHSVSARASWLARGGRGLHSAHQYADSSAMMQESFVPLVEISPGSISVTLTLTLT